MPRFSVTIQGAPIFLEVADSSNKGSGKVEQLGFHTCRLVKATSAEEASEIAKRIVINDLSPYNLKNPPDLPVQLTIEGVSVLSWLESLWYPKSRFGFIFYPDDTN